MPKTSSPSNRTFERIDADIAAATAERDRLHANCRDRTIPAVAALGPVVWADNIQDSNGVQWHHMNSGGGDIATRGFAASQAWLVAWEAQRSLEVLELERVMLQIERWRERELPTEADIAELSERVTEAKKAFESLRGELFRSREACREHERFGDELRRMLSRAKAEITRTDAKVRELQGLVQQFEAAAAGQQSRVTQARETPPPSEDDLLFVRDTPAIA